MLEWLEKIDRELFLFLNNLHADFLDPVFWTVSEVWFPIPLYILVLYLIFKHFTFKERFMMVAAILLTIILCDLTAKHLFKEVFLRYRPSQNLEIQHLVHNVNGYRGGQYGFVSSHSANMFGIASVSYFILKEKVKLIWLGFLIAGFIAYSRIYLGVHYPSDVIVGGIWGAFLGCLVARVYNGINKVR